MSEKVEIVKKRHLKILYKKVNCKQISTFSWVMVPLISIGGLWYPKLGLLLLGMMIFFLIFSYFKGRFWCGNLCPRGAFVEIFIKPISFYGKIPPLLSSKYFRLFVVIVFITVFTLRTRAAFLSSVTTADVLDRWGFVFVTLCLITTVIAVIVGVLFSPRAWCTFCPMGTIQKAIYSLNKGNKERKDPYY
jgi:polyferredoxin